MNWFSNIVDTLSGRSEKNEFKRLTPKVDDPLLSALLNNHKISAKKVMKNSIYDIFGILTQINDKNYEIFLKQSINPILTSIECALNRDLLLEKEKDSYYFEFDTKEITK